MIRVRVLATCDPHLASGARPVRRSENTCPVQEAPSARVRGPAWRPPACSPGRLVASLGMGQCGWPQRVPPRLDVPPALAGGAASSTPHLHGARLAQAEAGFGTGGRRSRRKRNESVFSSLCRCPGRGGGAAVLHFQCERSGEAFARFHYLSPCRAVLLESELFA